jgi:hypothetical protein
MQKVLVIEFANVTLDVSHRDEYEKYCTPRRE